MSDLQSRYVNIKANMSRAGVDPDAIAAWIRHPKGKQKDEYGEDFGGWPDAEVFWAVHTEPGKEDHFHMVVRFPGPVRWGRLRGRLKHQDEHHYSQPARAFARSVRYLLHLDNPEKTPIPRENLKTTPNVDQSELSLLLGAQKSSILYDLQRLPALQTFRAFDYLVNDRGHSPNEVCQVLRCLGAIDDWIKRARKDAAFCEAVLSTDEFKQDRPFLDYDSPLPVSQGELFEGMGPDEENSDPF